jgi:hypothetical protein
MSKPNTKAALIRYLKENPYIRWTHPGFGPAAVVHSNVGAVPHPGRCEKTEVRKFLRVQGGRFVFLTPQGKESHLDANAKQMAFDDGGFNVKFDESWTDMAGKSMRYDYIDEAAYDKYMAELHSAAAAEAATSDPK